MRKKVGYVALFLVSFFIFNFDVSAATIKDGVYTIQSAISNKVVDVDGGRTANSTNVQLYQSNGSDAQKWYVKQLDDGYYEITTMLDNTKSLDVAGGKLVNGTNVQIYNSNGSDSQKWYINDAGDGYYYIVSKRNGLYVDVAGGKPANKTNIQMYKGNKSNAQKFKFIEDIEGKQSLEDGIYSITSLFNNDISFDVKGDTSNEASIILNKKTDEWSQLWRVKYLGGGYYSITSYDDERFSLDVKGGKSSNGTKIQLYNSNNSNAQKWIIHEEDGYYNIISYIDKMYVDVKDGKISKDSLIQLYHGNGTNAQKFSFTKVSVPQISDGYYTLNSALNNNKVVSVNSNLALNGIESDLRTNLDINSQKWYIEYLQDGYYVIKSGISDNYVLDVKSGGTTNGTRVQLYTSNKSDAQKWYIKDAGDGYYYLIAKHSNKYMDVTSGNSNDGTKIQTYTGNGTNSQKFKITETELNDKDVISHIYEEGYYTISSKLDLNKVLDVDGGKKANGTNVWLYSNNNSIAQIWYLHKLDDGYYYITSSLNPETALTAASGNIKNQINVMLSKYTGTDTQKWGLKYTSDGYVAIVNKANGLNLDVQGGKVTNGTNIQLYESNNSNSQSFKITKNTNQKVYTGIDVSHHQNIIDWANVSNSGVGFVIIRAGYGGNWTEQDDKQFLNNVAACERFNIPYGLYLYSYASEIDDSEHSAQNEARHMLRLIDEIKKNNYSPNLGTKVFIDMEDNSVVNAGKDKLTAVSDTFCSEIESNGYSCGIYANKTWLTNHLNTQELAKKYEIWLAEWLPVPSPTFNYAKTQKPTYNLTPFKYWQFASDGKLAGITGNVDLDLGYDIFD